MILTNNKFTKSTHRGIEVDIENYYLNEEQKLIPITNQIIQELQKNTQKESEQNNIAKKFKNYQMLYIGNRKNLFSTQDFFVAIPKNPVTVPITRPENPNRFVLHPNNYCATETLKTEKVFLFYPGSDFKINIYTSWLEIVLSNNKVISVKQEQTTIETIDTKIYFTSYAKRSDGKIGFMCAKLISENNANQLNQYLKKFRK